MTTLTRVILTVLIICTFAKISSLNQLVAYESPSQNVKMILNWGEAKIVSLNEDRLYLLIENKAIMIDSFHMTSDNAFVCVDKVWVEIDQAIANADYYTWTCSYCGSVNPQGISHCLYCDEEDEDDEEDDD